MDEHVARRLGGDPTIDITTIGRKSGRPRRIEIWFVNVDGRIFITGTPGPRDWYANLRANPQFTFHLKGAVTADLEATAAPVLDETTRRTVLTHATTQWYRELRDIDALVSNAPMVEVTFSS